VDSTFYLLKNMENRDIKKPLRLLLVEDSVSDAALLEEYILSSKVWDIYLSVARTLEEAVAHLKDNYTDAVLLDLTLPDSRGLDTVLNVKKTTSDIPIVVLTGIDDEKTGIDALRIGAQDYLVKGQVDGPFIIRAVDYAIERKKAEEAVRLSEQRLRLSLQAGKSGAWEWDILKNQGWLSPETYELFGFEQEMQINSENMLLAVDERDRDKVSYLFSQCIATHTSPQMEFRIHHPLYGLQWVMISANIIYDDADRAVQIIGIVMDITERKQIEQERENTIEFLRIINKSTTTRALVRGALSFFQKHFGCEAAAVRLKNGEDYPYFETKGFPEEFILQENYLSSRDLLGQTICDKNGEPVLECMCGNVIKGLTDPQLSYFTQHGTFWTNSTSEFLLEKGTKNEKGRIDCNKCNVKKYESMALLPMRIGHERLGLLQLSDRHKGHFTVQLISSLERLVNYFTVAISKFRSDEALHESKEDLKRAQEVAHLGSWRLNVRKNELTWSEETYRIFGSTRGAPQNYETFLDKVHPDDREYVDKKWKAALHGEPYNIEHRILADGRIKWVRERAELEFDRNRTLTGGFGTIQDISELKEVEEQIKNLAKFPSENPYPVLRVLADGTISYGNSAADGLLKFWNKNIGEIVPDDWKSLIDEAIKTNNNILKEETLEKSVFSFTITPIKNSGYINIYGRDITEYRNSQKELRKTNLELEDRVKERTRQLEKIVEVLQREIIERTKAETKLIENQEKLRALSSELIMVEERERRQVATHLHDSIGQLLAFSKKELGALIKIAPDEMKGSLQEIWEFVRQAVEETRTLTSDLSPSTLYAIGFDAAIEELAEDSAKKGKFTYNFRCDLPQKTLMEQDKILFYRSIRELLINIIKYSQAKNVDINVEKINHKIRIVVKDDGIGFNVKDLDVKKGKSGFGLFSIQERLETLGGNLKVHSQKGKGTTVILTAPLSKGKQRKGV